MVSDRGVCERKGLTQYMDESTLLTCCLMVLKELREDYAAEEDLLAEVQGQGILLVGDPATLFSESCDNYGKILVLEGILANSTHLHVIFSRDKFDHDAELGCL